MWLQITSIIGAMWLFLRIFYQFFLVNFGYFGYFVIYMAIFAILASLAPLATLATFGYFDYFLIFMWEKLLFFYLMPTFCMTQKICL